MPALLGPRPSLPCVFPCSNDVGRLVTVGCGFDFAANTVTLESLELLKKMRKLYIFNHIYIVASVIIIIVIIVIDRHHFIMFVLTH